MQPCMFSVDVDVYEYDENWCIWMQPCMFSVYVDLYECDEYTVDVFGCNYACFLYM